MYILYPWGKPTLIAAGVILCAAILLGLFFPAEVPAWSADPFPELYAQSDPAFVPDEGKVVYWTFDDGPSRCTEKILDVLAEEGIEATFFVTAQQTDDVDTAAVLQRMVREGHAVGIHTYSHDYDEIYADVDAYLRDFEKIRQYITETTGLSPTIFRFPGGSAKNSHAPAGVQTALREELTRRGFVYYDWNVVSGDDRSYTVDADTLVGNILSGARGKDKIIILCHDDAMRKTTADVIAPVTEELRRQGYRFEKLTERVLPVQLDPKG